MFVYFIKEERSGLIKIGYSENPQKRLKALQTGQAKDLEIILTVKGGAELESVLHKAFDFCRVRGEWFLLKRPQIEQAANIAIRHAITHSEKEYYYPDKEEVAIKTDHDGVGRPDTLEMEERPEAVSLIFRWIYLALATGEFNSEALFAKKEPTGERALYLHTPTLEKNWTLVMPERERPSSVDFRNSMRQVAPARTKITLSSAASNKERYKNVRVANLDGFSAWIKENDHDFDLDEALTALAKIRTLK